MARRIWTGSLSQVQNPRYLDERCRPDGITAADRSAPVREHGTGVRVLTTVSGAETSIADAIYSPDGTKIAYLQCVGDCGDPELQGQGSIWVMNANGSGKRRVFNGANGVQPANRLAWRAS